MALKDGLRDVSSVLPPFRPDLEKLAPLAKGRAAILQTAYNECATTCSVQYTPEHHEMEMWAVALMLGEYVAGLLLIKAEDGHCYAHKPCPKTSDMHLKMARDFKADLEKLTKEIEARIIDIEKSVEARRPKELPPPKPV